MTSGEQDEQREPDRRNADGSSVEQQIWASDQSRVTVAGRDLVQNFGPQARKAVLGGAPPECPYPGLRAFGTGQFLRFFGREQATREVIERLDERVGRGGAVMVTAPSGTGKSSLLQAGVLASVAQGKLGHPGSHRWPRAVFTPSEHPVDALAACLDGISADGPPWSAVLDEGPAAFVERMRGAVRHLDPAGDGADARWVLVVDQLEELFTQCRDVAERDRFLALLAAVSESANGRPPVALVLYGVRSDSLTPCAGYAHLRRAHANGLLLGPMTGAELFQAITHPAESVGMTVEKGLVDILMRDLGGSPPDGPPAAGTGTDPGQGRYEAGRLPHLAHALRATWQRSSARELTIENYTAVNGIAGSVARTANTVYEGLDQDSRRTARAVLLSLVRIGEGAENTRSRQRYADLLTASPEPDRVAEVVERFTRERLLTRQGEPAQGGDTVEITHDVLLRAWPQLRGWIDHDRQGNLLRQRIEDDAAEWDRSGRESGRLYRRGRLEDALRWEPSADGAGLTLLAIAFLESARQQRRRATVLRQSVMAALMALVLIASAAAVVAWVQRDRTRAETRTALADQIQAQANVVRPGDPSLAAQLDLVADRTARTPQHDGAVIADANGPLSRVLANGGAAVSAVAFSPDGAVLASGDSYGTSAPDDYNGVVRLWKPDGRSAPTPLGTLAADAGGVTSLAFGPKRDHVLAAGYDDGTVHLWGMANPRHPVRLGVIPGHSASVTSLAFRPAGNVVVVLDSGGDFRLWDLTDPYHPAQLSSIAAPAAGSVAFDRHGTTLAAATPHGVRLWNVADPRHPAAVGGSFGGEDVLGVAFSPAGDVLASWARDDRIRLWTFSRTGTATALGTPLSAGSLLNAVAFSPDGRTLASAGDDDTVRLWRTPDPDGPPAENDATAIDAVLRGHTDIVKAVAFSPDGRTVASAGDDQTVRLWNQVLSPGRVLTTSARLRSVALAPDGRTLAAGGEDDRVRLWDMTAPDRPVVLPDLIAHQDDVRSVAFSPVGHVLATAGGDGTVRLWDVSDRARPQLLAHIGQASTGPRSAIDTVAFDQHGRILATAGNSGTVALLDVKDVRHPVQLGTLPGGNPVLAMALNPNGSVLATGNYDRTVRLWNIADPAHAAPLGKALKGHTDEVVSVAFSTDGRTLASAGASGDRTVRLWNVSDPAHPGELGSPLRNASGSAVAMLFGPDGTLASAGADHDVRLWNAADPAHPKSLGDITGNTDSIQGLAFDPHAGILASAADDGTVRIWWMDATRDAATVCAATGPLTRQQWHQYVPGMAFSPSCG